MSRVPVVRFTLLLMLVAALSLSSIKVARANHIFSDVPASAIYHDAAEWLFNRAITLGCATGLYCPNDFVTRAQMALFMNRLGTALTPIFIRFATVGSTILNLDASPFACLTTTDYIPAYPQIAIVHARVSIQPTAALAYQALLIYSTNSGSSWNLISSALSVEARLLIRRVRPPS